MSRRKKRFKTTAATQTKKSKSIIIAPTNPEFPDMLPVQFLDTARTIAKNTDDLLENQSETLELYQYMLREPYVRQALMRKKLRLLSAEWRIKPDSKDPADIEAAEFISWSLKNLTRGFAQNLLEALDALDCGVSYLEQVLGYIDSGPWKGKITLGELRPWNPLDYDPIIGQDRKLTHLTLKAKQKDYPCSKFLVYNYLSRYLRHYGDSDLRSAYRAFFVKDTAWKLRAIYMERFSGSNLKITYSDDNKGESKKKAIEILQAWRTTTGVAIPKGVEVDVIHLATSSRSEFEASINDCNREILVGILGSHLIVEEGAKTGSRSAGETHDESLNDWADYLELTLREAIRLQVFTPLARLNFANANPPHLRFPGRGKDLKLTAEVDTLLNDMGVEFHEDHFYDTYGRRRPEEVTKPNLQN